MDFGDHIADPVAEGIEQGWITPAVKPGSLAPAKTFRSVERINDVLDLDRGD